MPSVKNPNHPSKNRLAARANKTRKNAQKASEAGQYKKLQISIKDKQRGAKPGLLPTSGPRAAVSKKKAKKLEQRARLNLRRKIELGLADGIIGEVEMKGT